MKFNTKATEEKMQKSVNAYENNLSTIRASQANGAIVSKVTFDYYGSATKLTDMASVAVTGGSVPSKIACAKAATSLVYRLPEPALSTVFSALTRFC